MRSYRYLLVCALFMGVVAECSAQTTLGVPGSAAPSPFVGPAPMTGPAAGGLTPTSPLLGGPSAFNPAQSALFQAGQGQAGSGVSLTSANVATSSSGASGAGQRSVRRKPGSIGDFFGGAVGRRTLINIGRANCITIPGTDPSLGIFVHQELPRVFADGSPSGLPLGLESYTNLVEFADYDFATNTFGAVVNNGPFTAINVHEFEEYDIFREIVLPNPGDMVGRVQVSDNNSPFPRDRVYFDYSYFHSARLSADGVNVHRYAPGFEKTFLNQRASIELRLPFATTMGAETTQITNGPQPTGAGNTEDVELGNLSIIAKFLMAQTPAWVVSGGLQTTLPTASDVTVTGIDNSGRVPRSTQLLRIENESVHLMPFLAASWTPERRFFTQTYLQADFDATGNTIISGATSTESKNISFLYLDWTMGYWLYSNIPTPRQVQTPFGVSDVYYNAKPHALSGFAPRFELHYSRSLEGASNATTNGHIIGQDLDAIQILNMVVGATMTFGNDRDITVAWVKPLSTSSDEEFDHEIRAFVNWYRW